MTSYQRVADDLRRHYDATARRREEAGRAEWKREAREHFFRRLQAEGKRSLLEIGAGPGHDSLYFQNRGLDVVATDLSPAMVELCRAKGLNARVGDFLSLDFGDEIFDAVYALNCLLHVPRGDLAGVLENIRRMMRESGLFNVITYGGAEREGNFVEGGFEEERFLSYYTRAGLVAAYSPHFEVIDLNEIATGESERPTAFSLVLRRSA